MEAHLKTARQARKRLEKIRIELLDPHPQCLDKCLAQLENAIRCMEQLAGNMDKGRISMVDTDEQQLRAELFCLRQDLSSVSALLENAARFYSGYAGLLGVDGPSREVHYSPAARIPAAKFAEPSERPFLVHG